MYNNTTYHIESSCFLVGSSRLVDIHFVQSKFSSSFNIYLNRNPALPLAQAERYKLQNNG